MCPLPNLRFTTPQNACFGGGAAEGVLSAAAERRLNGVAYTAPKSRLPKKTER